MKRTIFATVAALALAGCTDPYGRVGPGGPALPDAGGGVGTFALGAAIQQSRLLARPAPVYGWGAPAYGWGRPLPHQWALNGYPYPPGWW